jgi:hypothetical protein
MTKLLSYKHNGVFPFGDGEYYTSFELTLLKTSWFGLVKKEIKVPQNLSMFCDVVKMRENWDRLIETGEPITIKNK